MIRVVLTAGQSFYEGLLVGIVLSACVAMLVTILLALAFPGGPGGGGGSKPA